MGKLKKVIDADNNKLLEEFEENQTDEKLEYYKSLGKWEDVSLDNDGDIILWKE